MVVQDRVEERPPALRIRIVVPRGQQVSKREEAADQWAGPRRQDSHVLATTHTREHRVRIVLQDQRLRGHPEQGATRVLLTWLRTARRAGRGGCGLVVAPPKEAHGTAYAGWLRASLADLGPARRGGLARDGACWPRPTRSAVDRHAMWNQGSCPA